MRLIIRFLVFIIHFFLGLRAACWFKYWVSGAKTGNIFDREITEEDIDNYSKKCPECGHTPETGACYFCKMD